MASEYEAMSVFNRLYQKNKKGPTARTGRSQIVDNISIIPSGTAVIAFGKRPNTVPLRTRTKNPQKSSVARIATASSTRTRPQNRLDTRETRVTPKPRKIEKPTIQARARKTEDRSSVQTRIKTKSTERVSGDRRTEKVSGDRRTETTSTARKVGERLTAQRTGVRTKRTQERSAPNPEKRSTVHSNGTRSKISTSTACVKEPRQKYRSPLLADKNGIQAVSPPPPVKSDLIPPKHFIVVDERSCKKNPAVPPPSSPPQERNEKSPQKDSEEMPSEQVSIISNSQSSSAAGDDNDNANSADHSPPSLTQHQQHKEESEVTDKKKSEDNNGNPVDYLSYPQEDSVEIPSKQVSITSNSLSSSAGNINNDANSSVPSPTPPQQQHQQKEDPKIIDDKDMEIHKQNVNHTNLESVSRSLEDDDSSAAETHEPTSSNQSSGTYEIESLSEDNSSTHSPVPMPLPLQQKHKGEESKVIESNNESFVKSFRLEQERRALIRKQQDRIVILRHVANCTHIKDVDCPVAEDCARMKLLWKHILKCNNSNCQVSQCISSRYILAHYHNCTNEKCEVCSPVKSSSLKTAAIKKLRGSNISFGFSQSTISNLTFDVSSSESLITLRTASSESVIPSRTTSMRSIEE